MNVPQISVIVLVGEKGYGFNRFYSSFINTQPIEKVEIIFILPESTLFECPEKEKFSAYKEIRYTHTNYFNKIKQAVEECSAEYILFQESHTDLKVNVIDSFLKYAVNNQYACIGCLMYPGEDMSFTDWVAYLGHYSGWGPGTKGGSDVNFVPGHNCVYKKSHLIELGKDLEIYLYADTIIQWKFLEKGLKLYLIDEVYMIHDDKMTFWNLLTENFWYGWIFSYARSRMHHWSIAKRLLYAVLVYVKPLIRIKNYLKTPLDNYSISKGKRLPAFFAILFSYYWNALGESFGVIFGDKLAAKKFSEAH